MRRSLALAHGDEFKLSGRRSFFRRSKKGLHGMSVNHSRDGSDSATSITTSCTGLFWAWAYYGGRGIEGVESREDWDLDRGRGVDRNVAK